MRRVVGPLEREASSSAAPMPSTMAASGTPRRVCACGSKKISAWRMFCARARAR